MSGQLAAQTREALAAGGDLAKAIETFTPRVAQQDLAAAIADAIEEKAELVSEAGTGTGKTFAYLVPAILSGQRTIISTGTKALQDQLFKRDLPRVREALGKGFTAALLKGRANYLCLHRMNYSGQRDMFASPAAGKQFETIRQWSERTMVGDFSELATVPDDSPVFAQVSSTAENCLGQECEFYGECFVMKARQRAQTADVIVVNHHLLLADLSLKDTGMGKVLPDAQVFVIDEAHQLPELAGNFLGSVISGHGITELGRDTLREAEEASGTASALRPKIEALSAAVKAARTAMIDLPARAAYDVFFGKEGALQGLEDLADATQELAEQLHVVADQTPGLLRCAERADDILVELKDWISAKRGNGVYWFELSQTSFRLRFTPLDVSESLQQQRAQSQAAWIMTSATLAVDQSFTHYSRKLGLDSPRTTLAPSPFDWEKQALLYVPEGLPEPHDRSFVARMIESVIPVLEASKGRAFLLFASHRNLQQARELLRGKPWPLFVQGEGSKHSLLDQFRKSGNGVLLGTATFREGVDVVGDALSVVVIDKLPFAPPDDPVFKARIDEITANGGNPFNEEQVPSAVISMKQAAGRLIRSETDRGVLVITDPRFISKSYGRTFRESLPPMPMTRKVEDVEAFFAEKKP